MKMPLGRVIIFVGDVQRCAQFYQDVFGFKVVPSGEPAEGWMELDTGGAGLAFHKARGVKGPTGSSENPHKIVFYAKDVVKARAEVVAKGAKMGKVIEYGDLRFCDGKDPEGHVFQISNRV